MVYLHKNNQSCDKCGTPMIGIIKPKPGCVPVRKACVECTKQMKKETPK